MNPHQQQHYHHFANNGMMNYAKSYPSGFPQYYHGNSENGMNDMTNPSHHHNTTYGSLSSNYSSSSTQPHPTMYSQQNNNSIMGYHHVHSAGSIPTTTLGRSNNSPLPRSLSPSPSPPTTYYHHLGPQQHSSLHTNNTYHNSTNPNHNQHNTNSNYQSFSGSQGLDPMVGSFQPFTSPSALPPFNNYYNNTNGTSGESVMNSSNHVTQNSHPQFSNRTYNDGGSNSQQLQHNPTMNSTSAPAVSRKSSSASSTQNPSPTKFIQMQVPGTTTQKESSSPSSLKRASPSSTSKNVTQPSCQQNVVDHVDSMESDEDNVSASSPRSSNNGRRTKKSTRACEACRKHHRKCDGASPCKTCVSKGIECIYTERKKRGPKNEASKLLKKEIEELREQLLQTREQQKAWEQRYNELLRSSSTGQLPGSAFMAFHHEQSACTTNSQSIPPSSNSSNLSVVGNTSQPLTENNPRHYPQQAFNPSMSNFTEQQQFSQFQELAWNSNTSNSKPVQMYSTSASFEDSLNKKRKCEDETNIEENSTKKVKKAGDVDAAIEELDLTNTNAMSPMRCDGHHFALCSMVTRFVTFWDKFVHPFHSLLPMKWQSAMPDLLFDIIRSDGHNSENSLFMYSLLCNSARSIGDVSLSRDLHQRAIQLLPLHSESCDPRVGFSLVLLGYYNMSVGSLKKALEYSKNALQVAYASEKPPENLIMNAYLAIASISDDYEERKRNFKLLAGTGSVCDVLMGVSGDVQNEITHGGNNNYKDLITRMADLLRLKNLSATNVTLMHEVGLYGILVLCLHKACYRDLAISYGRKLLDLSKDSNFKHCCIGTTSSAIAQAASMFLDFECYPEFYECMTIMDELSLRFELAGMMKSNVQERFTFVSNQLALSSSGSSNSSLSPGNFGNIF